MKPERTWTPKSVLRFRVLQALLRAVHRDSTLTGREKDELFASGAKEIAELK